MKILSNFIVGLEDVKDIFAASVDVYVLLEDYRLYSLVFCTPRYLMDLMYEEQCDSVPEKFRSNIIVRKITKEVIEQTILDYSSNGAYWLDHFNLIHNDIEIADIDEK